ncbi:pentapeptide repeat-containing protein [Nodosilinea sp. P-1105]|uniref:pentapeptide repeat-containing protein n=1 Tax=Nodosilinea sp. P-1105 TaxID=2546229 RepID=UPI00146C75CB|nr:pentapeptide repeat-containing protein [Nodosilinea sp. P-1105]
MYCPQNLSSSARHFPRLLLGLGGWGLALAIGVAQAADTAQLRQLLISRSCIACDLSQAVLAGAQLDDADLTRANLSHSRFAHF